jgi:hypothetical protein
MLRAQMTEVTGTSFLDMVSVGEEGRPRVPVATLLLLSIILAVSPVFFSSPDFIPWTLVLTEFLNAVDGTLHA